MKFIISYLDLYIVVKSLPPKTLKREESIGLSLKVGWLVVSNFIKHTPSKFQLPLQDYEVS